jgi:hypothetical protein
LTPPARRALERLVGNQDCGTCLCDACGRLVTGRDGDVKICVVHGGASLVLCSACFGRDKRRDRWLEWNSLALPEPSDPWLAACRGAAVG